MNARLENRMDRLDVFEAGWCALFNKKSKRQGVARLFAVVSRLGDGVFWYSLMAALPFLWGMNAVPVVLKMALAGVSGVIVYKCLKLATRRQRPCVRHESINNPVLPLDEYSFPSGHTLHAVGFTVIAGAHFPVLLWMLIPIAVLIAASRLVLGLHYPSDVIAGAMVGGALAGGVLFLSAV